MTTEYKGFWLRERPDGSVDAVNKATGQWFNRPTMRGAKWAISAYTRIHDELMVSGYRQQFPGVAAHWHKYQIDAVNAMMAKGGH